MGAADVLATFLALGFLMFILLPFIPGLGVSGGSILSILTFVLVVYALAQVSEVGDEVKALRKELEKLRGESSDA